jgi:hypothetical protein
MPVGAAAVVSAGVNAVIGEASETFSFTSFLLERDVQLPALWLLIHKADMREWNIPAPLGREGTHVAQEVHVFPGAPVLEQCPVLAHEKLPVFHTSPAYQWDIRENATYITSIGNDPFPLYRYLFPAILRTAGTCPCGRVLVERKPQ